MDLIREKWNDFSIKHKLIAQFVKFYAFSLFVTVVQYLLLTFLPSVFYKLTDWCDIPCQLIHLAVGPVDTYVFNYPVTGDATGGMGYFAAFAVTLFIAQCIKKCYRKSCKISQRYIQIKGKYMVSNSVVYSSFCFNYNSMQFSYGYICTYL